MYIKGREQKKKQESYPALPYISVLKNLQLIVQYVLHSSLSWPSSPARRTLLHRNK